MTDTIQNIINRNQMQYCVECGKCSAVCPITKWDQRGYTSPRLLVEKAIDGGVQAVINDELFRSCLTCKRCHDLCFSDVRFAEFIRDTRALTFTQGVGGTCTHGDVIDTWGRIMTDPTIQQNRLGWLTHDLKVSDRSDIIFFAGCLPHYDVLFDRLEFEGVSIARAAIKILNHLGIEPHVMADERCCGHDQLWQGDLATFRKLAELNLDELRKAGAKQIITTCPECTRTLKLDYPQYAGAHGAEVLHITQLLARPEFRTRLKHQNRQESQLTATFHDPCRLGRHLNVYDEPRLVLADRGIVLKEMAHTRNSGFCCGTSCWTSCGQVSKKIQTERLLEAQATGADVLVTACAKCQIHFKCALQDPALWDVIDIPIRDIVTLLAEGL